MKPPSLSLLVLSVGLAAAATTVQSQDHWIHTFKRLQLTPVYYCEGGNFGDLNQDGKPDVVAGPFWYEGPAFEKRHELYQPVKQDLSFYADNFFSWVRDFNGDGWNDVFVVGFPGKPAYWYENPKGKEGFWPKHEVFDSVNNESPHFTQLVGDPRPELICARNGMFGYATVDWDHPTDMWAWHAISGTVAPMNFGHGLGVGDIDGDGRMDVIYKDGWFQQPARNPGAGPWLFHHFEFTSLGGAQMYAYDVDGDGDNDVITSLAAHEHGLAWFEHQRRDGKITFEKHLIMGNTPAENHYGVVFSELHAVDLCDMDGDGLKDIVTGKTYWSHHTRTPSWHDGAVVYWFKLVRGSQGVDFIPFQADDDSGIGRQVVCGDVNGDGLPDVVSANMKGTYVLLHERRKVSAGEWAQEQPQPYERRAGPGPVGVLPQGLDGHTLNLDFEKGNLADWTATGDAFQKQPVEGEIKPERKWGEGKQAHPQGKFWIGGFEVTESDTNTGTLVSAPFKVIQPFASYRIGGGCLEGVRMELVRKDTGKVVFSTYGRQNETMVPEVVDLRPQLNQTIFIRLVDEQKDGFGHLNFDNFRFHEQPPRFPDAVNQMKRAEAGSGT